MKARTKLEFRIVDLSKSFFGISKSQKAWAYKECLQHKGFANKSSAFCLDCGNTFSLSLISRKRATCPHCNTKLNIVETRKTTDKQTNYFAIAHVVEEFQVIQNYELIAWYKKGKPVEYFLHAILEYWIDPKGKNTMIGRSHNCSWWMDSWSGDWEIRKDNHRAWYNSKYNVYARKYHPSSIFKPEYTKYGINANLSGITFLEAIKILPYNPKAETLLKAKEYTLLAKYADGSRDFHTYWPSIKIAMRNRYKIKDVGIWFDYLELLRRFNKDLHSPKYICPKNLKAVHDKLVAKKRAEDKRRRELDLRKQVELEQKDYQKAKKAFFGLAFTNGELTVKVLESVKEFLAEADAHHHCVFANEYYKKPDSLILSAQVNGKPVETVEVLLSKMKIVQSRGLGNQASEFNPQIIDLVKKNMGEIKKRHQQSA